MARPKEFDAEQALDAAIGVFREHGYEGSSAQMLIDAMGIGRQSLYDTFGDKWQLYRLALDRNAASEQSAHLGALRRGPRALDGIRAMLEHVVQTAAQPCLGVSATCEFGQSRADLLEMRARYGRALQAAIGARVREAQEEGDVPASLDPGAISEFLMASIASIRITGRGGAEPAALSRLAEFTLRALH